MFYPILLIILMSLLPSSRSFFLSQRTSIVSRVFSSSLSSYSRHSSNEIANIYRRPERSNPTHDFLFGINPIHAALHANRRKLKALYVQDSFQNIEKEKGKDKHNILKILRKAGELGLPVEYHEKHSLNLLSKNRPHQGIVLKASPLEFIPIKTMPKPENDEKQFFLVLDEVSDPQNLGAILRSCYFLGVDGIIVCSKNSAPLNEVVSKTSSGALELVKIYSSSNLMRLIDDAKKNDWMVYGTGLSPTPSKPADSQESLAEENEKEETSKKGIETIDLRTASFSKPTLVILGSEGEGIRTNILRRCDKLIKVTKSLNKNLIFNEDFNEKTSDSVDSLNVSVTCGIILNHFLSLRD